jgi:hypothetical protein
MVAGRHNVTCSIDARVATHFSSIVVGVRSEKLPARSAVC